MNKLSNDARFDVNDKLTTEIRSAKHNVKIFVMSLDPSAHNPFKSITQRDKNNPNS